MWIYWKKIIKRAWRRSLELVRWESSERIAVFLIILAVPFGVTWWLLGDHGGAAIRALASLGATSIAVLVLFGWNVMKLPAVLDAERQAEISSLSCQFETEEQQVKRRDTLGQLLEMANKLLAACCSSEPLEQVVERLNQWNSDAHTFADSSLDGANRALLWSDTGIVCGVPSLTEERKGYWLWMNYRAIRIQQIIAGL